jgi:predicted DNA-binding antitoxin AbrB/MazE fold protein
MAKTIEAIFENGVFKPLEKVDIKEHEKVLVIFPYPGENQTKECSLYGIIDIAKDCSDTDLSIHHDKYLYGKDTD